MNKIFISVGVASAALFILTGAALLLVFFVQRRYINQCLTTASLAVTLFSVPIGSGSETSVCSKQVIFLIVPVLLTLLFLFNLFKRNVRELFLRELAESRSEADATRTKAKIVIDHDGGADDALAITMCLLNEKYFNGPEVVALSVTHGNVNLSQAVINSARILQLAGRSDIPIYSGAEHALIEEIESDYYFGKDGLGDDGYVHSGPVKIEKQHAAVGLIELSKIYEGELVIMAIGPLTNVALAARMDPELINRISHLYVGGGDVYDEQHPTAPEFNAEMDVESYYITTDVAELNKVTIVPFSQIRSSLTTTRDWRENVLGKIDTPIMKALNSFERVSIAHSTKWVLLDPAVAAITLNDGVVRELRNTRNSIILCGQQRAITTNNFTSTEPNSKLVYSAELEIYKQMLIDIYTAELKYY